MSALPSMSPAESAAAYERHISDNWNVLSPFEQEQAKAYMQAKFQGSQPAQPVMQSRPGFAPQPGFPQQSYQPANSSPYGGYYGDPSISMYGAFAPPKPEQGGGWAVPVGYVGLFIFSPLAFICGIVNLVNGRTGHGIAQLLVSSLFFIVGMMVLMAG